MLVKTPYSAAAAADGSKAAPVAAKSPVAPSSKSSQGTPAWLGAVNDRTGLALLLEHGPLTRNRICELAGVSKPTASLMMARLEQSGFIVQAGRQTGTPGPAPIIYAARVDRALGVAVDIDAREIRSSVVDAAGTLHPVVATALPTDLAERDPVADIRGAIERACAASGSDPAAVHKLCIGIPGYVDPRHSDELFTEALPKWPVTGIRDLLEGALGAQVRIENDANLAATAERVDGVGQGREVFVMIWLGNGVGAAFDTNGSLHRGAFGGAGEIGFMPIPHAAIHYDESAREVQDLIGGRAVEALLARHGIPGATLPEALAALESAPNRGEVIADLAPRIAIALTPLLSVLDPELLVLGGPTGSAGGAELAALVASHIRAESRWYPEVVATSVRDHAVLQGARELLVTEVRAELLDRVALVGG